MICLAYLLSLQITGNFHEVVKGELYRSAQLSDHALALYVQKYHIKTIINLRGENTGMEWYDRERIVADAHNLHYVNFRMTMKRPLEHEDAMALIDQMKKAPKPVLIHCRAGADRTGLAVALYLAAISKRSEFKAELQLSPIYGHLPFRGGAPAMDTTFEAMEPMFGYGRS